MTSGPKPTLAEEAYNKMRELNPHLPAPEHVRKFTIIAEPGAALVAEVVVYVNIDNWWGTNERVLPEV